MSINGEKKVTNVSVSDTLLLPITWQIAYLSKIMTLNQGDVILTGTPMIDMLNHGDKIDYSLTDSRNPTLSVLEASAIVVDTDVK